MLSRINLKVVGAFSALTAFAVTAGSAFATGYGISPITNAVSSQLTADIPIVLVIAGALLALVIGVRLVRKFVKA